MDRLGQTLDLEQFEFLDRSNSSKGNWLLLGLVFLIHGAYLLAVREIVLVTSIICFPFICFNESVPIPNVMDPEAGEK